MTPQQQTAWLLVALFVIKVLILFYLDLTGEVDVSGFLLALVQ